MPAQTSTINLAPLMLIVRRLCTVYHQVQRLLRLVIIEVQRAPWPTWDSLRWDRLRFGRDRMTPTNNTQ